MTRVKDFELVNPEKVARALKIVTREDGTYDENELIAQYDKYGGLIRKATDKVKMGSFYDFKNKKAKAKPEVVFTYRVNGKIVDVPEGVELPGIVKAVKVLEEAQAEEIVVGKKSKKKK